jgi:hypothetical protein
MTWHITRQHRHRCGEQESVLVLLHLEDRGGDKWRDARARWRPNNFYGKQ